MMGDASRFYKEMTATYRGPRIFPVMSGYSKLEPKIASFDFGDDFGDVITSGKYLSTFDDGVLIQFSNGTEEQLANLIPQSPERMSDRSRDVRAEEFEALGRCADRAKDMLMFMKPETESSDRRSICDTVLSGWQALAIRTDGLGRTWENGYDDASRHEPTRAFEDLQARVGSMQSDLMDMVSKGCKAGADYFRGGSDGKSREDFEAACRERAYAFVKAYDSGFEGWTDSEKASAGEFTDRVREAADIRATYYNLPQEDVPGAKFSDFGLSYHGVGAVGFSGGTLDPAREGVKAFESKELAGICSRFEAEPVPASVKPEPVSRGRSRDTGDLDAAYQDIVGSGAQVDLESGQEMPY